MCDFFLLFYFVLWRWFSMTFSWMFEYMYLLCTMAKGYSILLAWNRNAKKKVKKIRIYSRSFRFGLPGFHAIYTQVRYTHTVIQWSRRGKAFYLCFMFSHCIYVLHLFCACICHLVTAIKSIATIANAHVFVCT